MAHIRKKLFSEIRDELGYFPTWPVGDALSLGQIGYYYGWNKEFEWVTSLSELGFTVANSGEQKRLFDECYSTKSAVDFSFSADAKNQTVNADIIFSKCSSVAAQGYNMGINKLSIDELNKQLIPKIISGELKWDNSWVVISEIFVADGFSALVGGDKGSQVCLCAKPKDAVASFNIADVTANIHASSSKKMAYQAICANGATPYFYVHKLVKKGAQPYFRRYASRVPKPFNK